MQSKDVVLVVSKLLKSRVEALHPQKTLPIDVTFDVLNPWRSRDVASQYINIQSILVTLGVTKLLTLRVVAVHPLNI